MENTYTADATTAIEYAKGYAAGRRDRFYGVARSSLWVTNPAFDAGYDAGLANALDDDTSSEVLARLSE